MGGIKLPAGKARQYERGQAYKTLRRCTILRDARYGVPPVGGVTVAGITFGVRSARVRRSEGEEVVTRPGVLQRLSDEQVETYEEFVPFLIVRWRTAGKAEGWSTGRGVSAQVMDTRATYVYDARDVPLSRYLRIEDASEGDFSWGATVDVVDPTLEARSPASAT